MLLSLIFKNVNFVHLLLKSVFSNENQPTWIFRKNVLKIIIIIKNKKSFSAIPKGPPFCQLGVVLFFPCFSKKEKEKAVLSQMHGSISLEKTYLSNGWAIYFYFQKLSDGTLPIFKHSRQKW
jgi:hypothetical protein